MQKNFNAVVVVEGKDDTIRLKQFFFQELRRSRQMARPFLMRSWPS